MLDPLVLPETLEGVEYRGSTRYRGFYPRL
jgi:hypothetical protein